MTSSDELGDVVLASASPRRLELLRALGLHVDVVPSGYAEPAVAGVSAAELASVHAAAKRDDVVVRYPEQLVVAADTVVDVDGDAWGKPHDADEAMHMLRTLSGRTHLVHTAFSLGYRGRRVDARETTAVRFFSLGEDDIANYVASGEPFDKAGAYGIQGRGAVLVERIEGDFYTVMGFPLARFVRALPELSLRLAAPTQSVAHG